MGYKAYSDSYLMSLTKAQIIELLRIAESNFFAAEEALNNSAKAGMEIAEKFDKAKRLLKAAVEDMHIEDMCDVCVERIPNSPIHCPDGSNCFVWRYKDEVLKLIES